MPDSGVWRLMQLMSLDHSARDFAPFFGALFLGALFAGDQWPGMGMGFAVALNIMIFLELGAETCESARSFSLMCCSAW